MVISEEPSFEKWCQTVPKQLQADPLWVSVYYQYSLYLYDLAWNDCELLKPDFRGREIVQQLIRSAGGICANLEEAYGRGIGSADNIRVVRIALGEAHETQGWYFRSRQLIPEEIISLIVRNISIQRQRLTKNT